MKTCVYVDGFNLYYGALRHTSYKWLNILRMCQLLLPSDQVLQVKYFSARVSARPKDLDQPVRQATFWRALRTIPEVTIIEGSFLVNTVSMPLANTNPQQYARVIKTEEKGSDVNLAAHMVSDAYKKKFEMAVLVTNDSDLAEPVRIVSEELGLPVGLVNPHKNPSFTLKRHALFIKQIRSGVLRASQFPSILTDANGTFHKPVPW